MDPAAFAEIVAAAQPVIDDVVYATLATVSADGEPRTRVVHPVWRWDDPIGLLTARPTPLKRRHLAANPRVSLTYWSPAHDVVTIDGTAAWVATERLADVWEQILAVPGPSGFDPATVWPDGPTSAGCAMLEVVPHRIRVVTADKLATAGPYLLWSA